MQDLQNIWKCLCFDAGSTYRQNGRLRLQLYLKKKSQQNTMNFSFEIRPFTTTPLIQAPTASTTTPPDQKINSKPLKAPKKSKVKISTSSWSKSQQRKYITFLKGNKKLFELSPKERKDIKINVLISHAVKTRMPSQCHSHHQKMMLKHTSIPKIIDHHRFLFEKEPKAIENDEPQAMSEMTETKESFQELIQEERVKPEPLWWRYLDLANNLGGPFDELEQPIIYP